jgi:hypothetical protein
MTLFTSCIKFNGNLEVKERLELYHEQNGKLYRRSLPTDNYTASFQVFNKNTVELNFDLRDGRRIKTRMLLPNISDRPTNDGDFFISSSRMAQKYDIQGNVETKVTLDPKVYYGSDVCHEWVNRHVCRRVCDARGCYNRCAWEHFYGQGFQNVEFQESIHNKKLVLNFINPKSLMSHGKFKGTNREIKRKYLYKGACRIY